MRIKQDVYYVAAPNHIWRLLPIPIISQVMVDVHVRVSAETSFANLISHIQVDQLIREKEYEDAISLCESLTNFDENLKADKLKEIKVLFAYNLFSQCQYERAMGFFSELNTNPLEVLLF